MSRSRRTASALLLAALFGLVVAQAGAGTAAPAPVAAHSWSVAEGRAHSWKPVTAVPAKAHSWKPVTAVPAKAHSWRPVTAVPAKAHSWRPVTAVPAKAHSWSVAEVRAHSWSGPDLLLVL